MTKIEIYNKYKQVGDHTVYVNPDSKLKFIVGNDGAFTPLSNAEFNRFYREVVPRWRRACIIKMIKIAVVALLTMCVLETIF
jgi:hypothetical protein